MYARGFIVLDVLGNSTLTASAAIAWSCDARSCVAAGADHSARR
jgi:hypothetical protein